MSSWMTTVLPVPAPPNTADLPPLRNGQIRSTTFMPVSKISAVVDWSVNSGGARWIGARRGAFFRALPAVGFPPPVEERARGSGPAGAGDDLAGVVRFL